jgi:hypothetical protein
MRAFILALAVCSLRASGAPIVIDLFTDPQTILIPPGGINPVTMNGGVSTGSNAIGGARTVELTRNAGAGFDVAFVFGGTYDHSQAAADSGFSLITWDGDTNTALNQNGFSVDLTGGGTNSFVVIPMQSDLAAPITMTLYSGTGNFSTVSVNTPALGFGGPFAEYYIPFSSFINGGGSGVDFNNVTAVTLLIDGSGTPGLDVLLSGPLMAAPAPEPATFGLAGVFLGAAFLLRKLRRAE